MKTQKSVYLVALAVLIGTSVSAAPFLAISENSEVFLTGGAGIRNDSNIFLSHDAKSDTIANFDVGAELKYGQQSTLNGLFTVNDSFQRYFDHTSLNTNLANARFTSNYDDQKVKLGFNASYTELNDNQFETTATTRDYLVRRNVGNIGAKAEMAATEKTSFGIGGTYERTDYRRAGYADSDIFTVPINYYLEVTPKVDLSVGYRYRDTRVSLGQDSRDDYYNVGARGQFTPKLSGEFTVGLNRRKLLTDTENQVGMSADFQYGFTPKTTMHFGAGNDFGTSGQGLQQKTLSFNAGVQTTVSEQWSFRVDGSYRDIQYATRTDHYFEGQLGAIYTVNAYVRLTAAYAHRQSRNDNTPAFTVAEFSGDVFSLSANFRY